MAKDNVSWYDTVSIPALLRHARATYGTAMRGALEEAGYEDIPDNGLYVIGGLARGKGEAPLGSLIQELRISKQAAGQLVDTLVARGYLVREADPDDRRRLLVALTERGYDAARVQTAARERIDGEFAARSGPSSVHALKKALATLVDIGQRGQEAA